MGNVTRMFSIAGCKGAAWYGQFETLQASVCTVEYLNRFLTIKLRNGIMCSINKFNNI